MNDVTDPGIAAARSDVLARIAAAARPVFALLGSPDALQVIHPEGAHDFPDSAREQAYRLLAEVLR